MAQQTVFHADVFKVGVTINNDEVLDTEQSSWLWTHEEFKNLFSFTAPGAPSGAAFPEDMTMISIEPHRNLYVYQENIDDNYPFDNPNDHPVIAALWAIRKEIRGQARCTLLNDSSYQYDMVEVIDYTYDKQTDTINTSVNPNSEKILATREVGVCRTKILRVLIDLIDVLLAQNVINTSQIPQDTKDRVSYVRSIIDAAEV